MGVAWMIWIWMPFTSPPPATSSRSFFRLLKFEFPATAKFREGSSASAAVVGSTAIEWDLCFSRGGGAERVGIAALLGPWEIIWMEGTAPAKGGGGPAG